MGTPTAPADHVQGPPPRGGCADRPPPGLLGPADAKPCPEKEPGPPTENDLLRERSGEVRDSSRLVAFLYDLMICHCTPGRVEEMLRRSPAGLEFVFSNGWLARYAQDVADRLLDICDREKCELPMHKDAEAPADN